MLKINITKNNPAIFVGLFLVLSCFNFWSELKAQTNIDSIYIKGQDYSFYLPSKDGINVRYELIKIYDSAINEIDLFKNIKIELKKYNMSSDELSDKNHLMFSNKFFYVFIKPKEASRKLIDYLSLSCKIDIKIKDNKVKFIFEDITIYDKVFGSTSEYALGSNYTIYLNGFITNTMLEYGINEKNVKNRIYETNNFTSSRLYALDYIINGINEALFQNINKNIRESNF